MSVTYDEGMVLTDKGRTLEAERRAAGKGLIFSRAVFGSGTLPDDIENLETVEAMSKEEMTLPFLRASVVGDGTARLVFYLDNSNVPAPGFPICEIGVFAKTSEADDAEEILYSYTNFGKHHSWMPSASSSRLVPTEFSLLVLVGYTTQITVKLDKELSVFALTSELLEHTHDEHAHPNLPHFGKNIKSSNEIKNLWADNGSGQLQIVDLDTATRAILRGDASTIPRISGRLTQTELEVSNIAFTVGNLAKNAVHQIYAIVSSTEPLDPNCLWSKREGVGSSLYGELSSILNLSNMLFYDDFKPIKEVNTLKVKVKAVTAGSRTIGLESLENVHPGESYTLTDGVNSEFIQVKSSSKNANIHRVVCKSDVAHAYDLNNAYIYRTTAGLKNGKLLSAWHPGEEIILNSKEFRADGIRELAYAQGLVRHGKLTGVKIRGFVSFLDEIIERKAVELGEGTGAKQTIPLPDDNIDYTTIKVYVNGVETRNFDANTETNPAEITLTAANGATITADYKCNYNEEDWKEMDLVTVQDYGESGMMASKFEYSLKDDETENTRVCIKWRLEAIDDTAKPVSVYGIAEGFAKVKDLEAA